MKKYRTVFLFTLLLQPVALLFGQYTRKITIEEMFELADANSRSIKTFSLAEQEAKQAVKVAKNALLPSVEVSLSAGFLGNVWLSDRDFSYGQTEHMPHFGNNFAIEASQVLYSGGAISASIALAELQYQLSQLNKEKNKQDIRFLLTANYLEMYKLKNQSQVYEKNMEQTRELLTEIKAKQEQGLVLKNDITRYELEMKSYELALTQVTNGITIINNQLAMVLGLPEETKIEVDTCLPHHLPALSNEIYWQEKANEISPVLQQSQLGIELSKSNEKLIKSGSLPSVALFAGDHLDGPITIEVPPINKNLNYWYIGIGVSFDISSTFKTGKERKLARLATRHAEENNLLVKENVRTEVKEAYIRFREAFTIYETRLKSLELADQNYRVINNRYLNELALLTDMLDASNSKLNAELQVINARINILFNYYKLQKVTGNL